MTAALHAFAFQTGDWQVLHRTLARRLIGCTEWLEFQGTCRAWEVLGGAGNIDDHWLNDPNGAYAAATVRRIDPETKRWAIWWLDSRLPGLGPPVYGEFQGGTGTFLGKDELSSRPIEVQYIWSNITSTTARWQQAFSGDNGATWETNWIMEFTRTD